MMREGFALLAVLWVMSLSSVLALDATLFARDDVAASANRADQTIAEWRANDCLERARFAIDAALWTADHDRAVAAIWRSLDRKAVYTPGEGCSVKLEAAGARLDLNSADRRQLATLFIAMDVAEPVALANALVEWRDVNGPLADVRQLARVNGFEQIALFDSVLSVEPGRIPLNSAPLTVLASLPGVTRETLARIASDRDAGREILDLMALAASVSPAAADSIRAHFPELQRLTTLNPEGWIVVARGEAGPKPVVVELEVRLALADRRAAITRMRSRR